MEVLLDIVAGSVGMTSKQFVKTLNELLKEEPTLPAKYPDVKICYKCLHVGHPVLRYKGDVVYSCSKCGKKVFFN